MIAGGFRPASSSREPPRKAHIAATVSNAGALPSTKARVTVLSGIPVPWEIARLLTPALAFIVLNLCATSCDTT
jgi:hypothetical protein